MSHDGYGQAATAEEWLVAESIAAIEARLFEIPSREREIWEEGRKQFQSSHADEPAATRAALIDAEIYMAFEKQLTQLSREEARLSRQLETARNKLRKLQASRKPSDKYITHPIGPARIC